MKRKPHLKPPINSCFQAGEIISWNFREKITPTHQRYAIRFTVTFANGTTIPKEVGGFKSKKKCLDERELLITQLNNHEFVAFDVTVKEFYDYWLHYYMVDEIKITYGTYTAYRNIIYNYIVPKIGQRKISSIKRNDIISLLDVFPSKSLLRLGYSVVGASFKCAKKMNMIHSNYAPMAIKTKRMNEEKKLRNLSAVNATQQNLPFVRKKSLTSKQICEIILLAHTKLPSYGYRDFYIPLLIACVTGCRISELIGFKYQNIRYSKKVIVLQTQLGRPLDDTGIEDGNLYKQELPTKSYSSIRTLPIPDFVIAEIVLAHERYQRECLKEGFNDGGFIWHQPNGRPHGRGDYRKPFNLLKEWMHLSEDFHWHDLRHAFATIMVENQVTLKELSIVLGHSDHEGIFSLQTYVNSDQLIAEGVPSYMTLLDEITPFAISQDGSFYEKENYKTIECPSISLYSEKLLPDELLLQYNGCEQIEC